MVISTEKRAIRTRAQAHSRNKTAKAVGCFRSFGQGLIPTIGAPFGAPRFFDAVLVCLGGRHDKPACRENAKPLK